MKIPRKIYEIGESDYRTGRAYFSGTNATLNRLYATLKQFFSGTTQSRDDWRKYAA